MITAIALDDEMPGLAVVENFCAQTNFIELVKTFSQPSEALKHLAHYPVDLLFLDIHMPSLTGLEFYKQVKQDTMVIFTTAYSQYAVEGFNLQAIDYLLKPFTYERFLQAANRAREQYELKHKIDKPLSHIFIRADYQLIKVSVADILYIEGLDDYLKIHLINQRPIVTRMTMKSIVQKLPAREFIRVHRSFIVPFARIAHVRNKMIRLGDKEIPVGASYEEEFFKLFKA